MRQNIFPVIALLVFCCLAISGQTAATDNLSQKFVDLPSPGFARPSVEPETKERPPEFFDDEKPPPDDAPIEDLLAYWGDQYGGIFATQFRPKPSAKTMERILDYCEENPESAARYMTIFPPKPEFADRIQKLYDDMVKAGNGDNYRLKEWLKYNSTHYEDELLQTANNIKDENNYVQNENQYVLRALARVDWDAALPIISRLESDPTNPYAQILAKWVSYQHAIDTGDFATESAYRHDLQKIVENSHAPWAQRDLAMDSLTLSDDWEGRDDWYVSLLEDESLLNIQENGYTGLTTLITNSPKKKWVEKMIGLTKSSNFVVRSAAVRNLMSIYREGDSEVAKALLPWLSNPAWAKSANEGERSSLIRFYGEADVPEAVPDLILIVLNDEENRDTAATALTRYKDPRAIPALKFVLSTRETHEDRVIYIGALLACGGFTDGEQMAALEAYARMISTEEGKKLVDAFEDPDVEEDMDDVNTGDSSDGDSDAPRVAAASRTKPANRPLPLQITIGSVIAAQEEPSEGLVQRAIERLKALRRTSPAVAETLAEIMEKWKGRAMYLEMLRRIRSGEANIDDYLNALASRVEMRDKVDSELSIMRSGSGVSRAISACIAEDRNEYLSILGGEDITAKIWMLGCTRLLRAKLPVNEVGELLNTPNALLSRAAERYLESEDSLEARKLVLGKNKNEEKILGARYAFVPDVKTIYASAALSDLFTSVTGKGFSAEIDTVFRKKEGPLQKEMKDDPEMLAIYAFLPSAETGAKIIRAYKGKIVLTYYEDTARYREKTLDAKEYEVFYNFIVGNNIDGMQPKIVCEDGCPSNEFVMFGRDGGRRVFYAADSAPSPLNGLEEIFNSFLTSEDVKLRYKLSDAVTGLEMLWTNPNLPARAVWAKNGDIRLLVEDHIRKTEIIREMQAAAERIAGSGLDEAAQTARSRVEEQKMLDAKYGHFSWRKLENEHADTPAAQPPETPFLYDNSQVPETLDIRPAPRGWQVRSGTSEIRVGEYYEPGLFRLTRGKPPVKLKEGFYETPIVTADGLWAVVSKTEEDSELPNLVRVNLQTGREYKINLPPSEIISPVAFISSYNRVLVYQPGKAISSGGTGEAPRWNGDSEPEVVRAPGQYFLLDAATGLFQRVRGEFRPLEQQTYRPLQPTGVPGESWAAIYDAKIGGTTIGRYSEKTFSFKPGLTLPSIKLDSMDFWIDQAGGKLYFVYEGHLLSLPVK